MTRGLNFSEIPGPPPLPLLGWRGNVMRWALDPLGYIIYLHKNFGDLASMVQGGNPKQFSTERACLGTVFAFSPHYNREILNNPAVFQLSLLTGLEKTQVKHLGAGMFNMNGEQHKRVRRVMAPAFQQKSTECHYQDLLSLTSQMLDDWRSGGRKDVLKEMQRLSFRVTCKTLFGLDQTAGVDGLGGKVRQWVRSAYSLPVLLLPFNLPCTPFRRFLRLSRHLEKSITSLLENRRSAAATEENMLALLIRTRDQEGDFLTENELIGQIHALLIASHDTTAGALTWTLFLLSQHPVVLADLLDELEGKLSGAAPTLEQLPHLHLLEKVVKESLRLLPPVPFAGRITAEPANLGPYRLAQGTEVMYSQYITHRLPDIYPQPQKFLPERWSRITPSPYEYLPFGAGPGRCLGAHLGLTQIKIILAMIIRRYRLQLVPGARVDRLIRLTMLPKHGMPMIVRPQDRQFVKCRPAVCGNVREMVDLM